MRRVVSRSRGAREPRPQQHAGWDLLRDQRRSFDHWKRGLAQRVWLPDLGLGGGDPHQLVQPRIRDREHRSLEPGRHKCHLPGARGRADARRGDPGGAQRRSRRTRRQPDRVVPRLDRCAVRRCQRRRRQSLLDLGARADGMSVRVGWLSGDPVRLRLDTWRRGTYLADAAAASALATAGVPSTSPGSTVAGRRPPAALLLAGLGVAALGCLLASVAWVRRSRRTARGSS